jgi:hypothetical protein
MKLSMVMLMLLGAFPAFADEGTTIPMDRVPAEARPFVEQGARPLAVESADLNGDGLPDFVLVLEKQKVKPSDPDIDKRQRPLLILVGQPGGALKEVKRNESIVYCSTCGGAMGDPFVGVEAAPKTFTVSHYGGSAQRWSLEYRFNYSRRDNTWQLVRVTEESFSALEPNKVKTKVYTPPKDYGKIAIEDFDPENWKHRGVK